MGGRFSRKQAADKHGRGSRSSRPARPRPLPVESPRRAQRAADAVGSPDAAADATVRKLAADFEAERRAFQESRAAEPSSLEADRLDDVKRQVALLHQIRLRPQGGGAALRRGGEGRPRLPRRRAARRPPVRPSSTPRRVRARRPTTAGPAAAKKGDADVPANPSPTGTSRAAAAGRSRITAAAAPTLARRSSPPYDAAAHPLFQSAGLSSSSSPPRPAAPP